MAGADDDLDGLWDSVPRRAAPRPEPEESSSEEDSYFQGDSEHSEDSARRRAQEAEARLRDYGGEASSRPGGAAAAAAEAGAPLPLPSAGDAFAEVDGPPAFLDPEATRPLATTVHLPGRGGGGGSGGRSANQAVNKRGQAAGEWDISKMAPQLKEEGRVEPGVIRGAAVRYATGDDRLAQPSAAAIAMLGGEGREDGEDGDGGGGGPGAARPPKHPAPKGKATSAMPVDKFMEKGLGGAQLPRKRQDRKEKEKEKRMRGQSTHAVWKSEAEMVLRQQYD